MTLALWIVLAVAVQRLGELVLASRNTKALKEQGAVEVGAAHYPLFVILHSSWLAALVWYALKDPELIWLPFAVFLAMQAARVWVIASLGRFWTTRIITVPSAPLVRKGPYRFLKHPNYIVAWVEIVTLPMAFGWWEAVVVFGVLKAALLAYRIKIEDVALSARAD
ncbi:MAG: isoprenylcysteine carboxylmethyltransferase family protein [Alphaproteobacteria bacterium]